MMAISPFNTPLRYPGGKGRLTRYVAELIEKNGLQGGAYVEAYAGGAGVALSLLYSEHVRTIHLNDISKPIFSFWYSVLNHSDEFCKLIEYTPIALEEWQRQKEIQSKADANVLELGFSTFYLNRTNRSGIIGGGVIGGKAQKGKWKIDARYNREALIERVRKIKRYKSRIFLYKMDAADFIKEHVSHLPKKSLTYFDPPYYVKGGGLYEHNYKHEDHEIVAGLVQTLVQQPWIVSYDNHVEIKRIYSLRRQQEFDLHYSANRRFSGKELMIFSDALLVPEKIIPSRATAT